MRVVVVTPPEPMVSWSDVRAHVRLEADDERQPFVMGLAAAAAGHIDGPAGWLGRAIGTQTLEARFDAFECGGFRLPYPPVTSVLSVSYVDGVGVEQTIASSDYAQSGEGVDVAWGSAWPVARYQREAVRIRYVAGYDDVPAPIKVAIGIMTQRLFEGRTMEEAIAGSAEALLGLYRVYA